MQRIIKEEKMQKLLFPSLHILIICYMGAWLEYKSTIRHGLLEIFTEREYAKDPPATVQKEASTDAVKQHFIEDFIQPTHQ